MNTLDTYCTKWGLDINADKTKVLIFNPAGKHLKDFFTIGSHQIDCTKEYKYLGITLDLAGKFNTA